MNHSYYEARAKEKLNALRKEGMMNQAYRRSRGTKAHFPSKLPKLILVTLIAVGLVQLFI